MWDIAPSNPYIAPVTSWRVLVGPIYGSVLGSTCVSNHHRHQVNTILAETIKKK